MDGDKHLRKCPKGFAQLQAMHYSPAPEVGLLPVRKPYVFPSASRPHLRRFHVDQFSEIGSRASLTGHAAHSAGRRLAARP